MSFYPNFHTDRPVWADKFIIDSCISVFSISTNSDQSLISYDSEIAELIIRSSKDLTNMNLLSVLFDFPQLLNVENLDHSIIIFLRKLYALSFFAGQFDGKERCDLIRNVLNIIKILTTEKYQILHDNLLIDVFTATVSFSLATISEYYKDVQFDEKNEESQLYFELANLVLKLFNNEDINNIEKSHPYFIEYFLNLFFSFPINSEEMPTKEQDNLIEQILKITLSYFDCFNSQTFNFGAFLIHLFKFFGSNYSISVQIDILKFISIIYERNQQFSEFLFNSQNFEMFSNFFYFVISKASISIDKDEIDKSDFTFDPSQQFTDEEILNIKTFDEPVTRQISLQHRSSQVLNEIESPIQQPKDLPSFSQCDYFQSFLDAIFIFCKLNPTAGHVQFIKNILKLFRKEQSFSMATFLMMWGRNYIICKYENAVDDLLKIGYFDTMLELAFDTLQCHEYKEFMSSLYPYVLQNCQRSIFFIEPLFSRYEISIIQFKLDEHLNNCIIKCCSVAPGEISRYFTPIFFDQRLSHLLLHLQNNHLAASMLDNDMKDHISKVRLMFLRYVAFLLDNQFYKSVLYISPMFVSSLLLMILESSTNEFAYYFIYDSLLFLKTQDRSISTIFTFFKKILKKALHNEKFHPISTQIMLIISNSFERNTETIAGVFLHTSFFPSLVTYVSFLNSIENMYLLLNIAHKCTLIQGDIADYLYEIDLFSKIYPLVISIFENNVPNNFLELLWSFVFNDQISMNEKSIMTTDSQIRPILNASPLTLIYKLLRPNKEAFLKFINYIQNCCDNNLKSTLEINNSNFPSVLISTFEEFHEMTEKSVIFDSVLALFSSLAAHSLKSRDALSFFHNFSTLKGDFRPYFTVDLLKTLLFLFQSPYDTPYSFYNLDKTNGIIYLPPVQVSKFTNFTFFIEIDLTEKPDHGVLFSFELSSIHFSLFFKNSQLSFEIGTESQKVTGSFNYIFTPNTWTHIVVTYQNGKLVLYVHGKEQANLNVSKIVFPEATMKSYLARNVSCNIGNFGFLRALLRPYLIKLLSLFPKTAVTSFMPSEINDFSFDMTQLFNGEIYLNSVYLYNAAISSSENSSVNLANVPKSENQMRIEGLIYGYSPQAKDMLRSIGGAAAFLPIFAQIDQPLMPKPGEEISYEHDPIFLPFLIQVLTSYLKDSPSNQEDFATINGFIVISYLLSRSKLQNITPQVIEMLKRLYKEIIVPRLAYQMLEYIFLDIRLWIYLPFDLQMIVYRSTLEIYNTSSSEQKRWFVNAIPFNKILYIMRVFFWSTYSNDEICLYNNPKINKVSQTVEGERPTNARQIRELFWSIAQAIFPSAFNNKSASAICFLSFDHSDPQFSVETLTFLLYLLRIKNSIMISTLISQGYTFEKFLTLLDSNNEDICCQCIHVFILLHYIDQKSKEIFFRPYSDVEWIVLIMAKINTKPLTTIFADVIYGYLYGFYVITENVIVPSIRISELKAPITSGYDFSYIELFPLAMLAIADLPDDVCSKYLMTIDRTATADFSKFTKLSDWALPFIMFLIHRVPTSESTFDNSSYICMHTLCSLYTFLSNEESICNLPIYVIDVSCRIGKDFSYILRHVYAYFIDFFMIKLPLQMQQLQQQQQQSSLQRVEPHIAYSIFLQLFEFIFIMNSTSKFYLPPFPIDGNDQINISSENNCTKVTFQELHRNKWNTAITDVQLCYATRTMDNGAWADVELAQKLLHALSLYPEVFTLKFKPSQIHPLFMYSFTLGIGLQHQFSSFERYIEFLIRHIPTDRSINDIQFQSLLNYLAGIVKVYFCTDNSHQSHFYLIQLANDYHQVISSRLKESSQMGQTINEFDTNFSTKPYTFAHVIIERFITNEISMMKYSQKVQRDLLKLFSHQSEMIAKVSSHFASLSAVNSNLNISLNTEQVELQLHQFALSIQSKQRESMKVYRTLWRSLSSEGGPWCPKGRSPMVYWKLKQMQPLSMIRGRFVINYNYNDHKDASLLRDVGKAKDAQDLYNDHLKRIRMSEFTGNHSLITIGVDADEETIYDIGSQDIGFFSDDIMSPIISSATDSIVLKADANRITMKKVYEGVFLLTNTFLTFNRTHSAKKSVSIPLVSITHIFTRRYLLMDTAIEVFTSAQRSYMFDFPAGQRNKILAELKKCDLPNLVFLQTCDKDAEPLLEKIRNEWQSGELSNFDYLMKLNLLAGRTYNDLSQYPVFPWIIADYESDVLNLDDPQTFRNLALPIGALDEKRLQILLNRREINTDDLDYLYGSFYSSSAVVIGYLIRIEPFTSLHIELQGGRFDAPNRLFRSIPKAWNSVSKTTMDFRELIPEFFYMPEFLVNSNRFDLGISETNDVELPPWASSARDFIAKNRAALESKYVSAMLPRWIDLIFGVLSRGDESKSVNNVFSPYFYESSLTPDVLEDPKQLKFIQEYAACFGHAPRQLFYEPHQAKKLNLMRPPISTFGHEYLLLFDVKSPVLSLEATIDTKRRNSSQIFSIQSPINQQNQISEDNFMNSIQIIDANFDAISYNMSDKMVKKVQLLLNLPIKNENIQMMTNTVQTINGFSYTAVPWDNAITISTLSSGTPLHIKRTHTKRITAIAVSNNYYATASLDCTVVLWRNITSIPQIPMSIMTKHSNYISCISINENVDLCVSASKNGDIITQSLNTGDVIRKITVKLDSDSIMSLTNNQAKTTIDVNNLESSESSTNNNINLDTCSSFISSSVSDLNILGYGAYDSGFSSIVVSEPTSIIIFNSGNICVSFAQSDRETVYVFDQNLEEIAHLQLENSLQCWTALEWPDEGDYVFAALKSGGLVIYKLPNFETVWSENKVDFVVTRLAVVKKPFQIIFGTSKGKIISLPFQKV